MLTGTDFDASPTTAITVVDRTTSAELLAARGGRRPEDARADRITLRAVRGLPGGEATFWGAQAWALADLMLVTWAETVRIGRTAIVAFSVRFGDGTAYEGEIPIARGIRRGRARLAERCRSVDAFARAFVPSAELPRDLPKVEAMLAFFLKNYEVGAPASARARRTTPVATAA